MDIKFEKENNGKRLKNSEIDLNSLVNMKHISDIIPQGNINSGISNSEMNVDKLPQKLLKTEINEHIPNLVEYHTKSIDNIENISINNEVTKRNQQIRKLNNQKYNEKLQNLANPLKKFTIILIVAWICVILYFLLR